MSHIRGTPSTQTKIPYNHNIEEKLKENCIQHSFAQMIQRTKLMLHF